MLLFLTFYIFYWYFLFTFYFIFFSSSFPHFFFNCSVISPFIVFLSSRDFFLTPYFLFFFFLFPFILFFNLFNEGERGSIWVGYSFFFFFDFHYRCGGFSVNERRFLMFTYAGERWLGLGWRIGWLGRSLQWSRVWCDEVSGWPSGRIFLFNMMPGHTKFWIMCTGYHKVSFGCYMV